MKYLKLAILFTILFSIKGFSQIKFPIEYRVEKQSMCTPMMMLEDVLFVHSYFTKPLNIQFDGANLKMTYDNGESFISKNLTQVNHTAEYEDNELSLESYYFTDNSNASDTLMFVVDYGVGYVQFIVPTKNSDGNNIGYTSYRRFVKDENLALK